MAKRVEDLLPKWNAQINGFSQQFRGLILSCSGGADSTALLHLFCEKLKAQKKILTKLFHVNYGLRGADAEADKAFALALGGRYGLEVIAIDAVGENETPPTQGIQEWAREIRRSHYANFINDGFLVVCAHHLDDLKETVLHRLARGASASHLLGMEDYKEGLWRPLLTLPKDALIAYLSDENCPHRHDASNDKMDYSRNFVRHRILPDLETLHLGAGDKLVATAKEVRDLADYCRKNMQSALRDVHFQPPLSFFEGLRPAVAFIALEEMMVNATNATQVPKLSRAKLNQIHKKLETRGLNWHLDIAKHLIFKVKDDIASVVVTDTAQKALRHDQHRKNLQSNRVGAFLKGKDVLECWWPRDMNSSMKNNSANDACTLIVKPFPGN